jgi:hypothetical protein
MFAANGMSAPSDVRSADQEGRSMIGTVVFRGVPNQQESASHSASAAVSAGSPVVAAQAMWASGRIRRRRGWPVIGFGGADVDAMLPVSGGLVEARAVGSAKTIERRGGWNQCGVP